MSGASTVVSGPLSGQTLTDAILNHPNVLGGGVAEKFGHQLPFLFKVLSVNKALSIQSHPDKKLAEELHRDRPEVYKDDNHKPEMAIALSDFEALCGFCSDEDLRGNFTQIPEIVECCGDELVENYKLSEGDKDRKDALQKLFTAVMTADTSKKDVLVDKLVSRIESLHERSPREDLILRLNRQYPGDIGVLSSCFLNYVRLKEGEGIALAANEPHAYLSGNIVECMATSDNVIRAGLTPKFKDTTILCKSLTYDQGTPQIISGESFNDSMKLYKADFDEFEVWKLSLAKKSLHKSYCCDGPSIMLVQKGDCSLSFISEGTTIELNLQRGDVYFIPSKKSIDIEANEDVVIWSASVKGFGPQV